ncbi:MAG TPA: two-component regulator propeller domain-containing protein, partial [Panacibacter sp.]|nr:two-component regulator propeller domain-containing protein [Panacibacter sp.]
NSINSIYKDNLGIVWLGTYKQGISYYHESLIKFSLYRHQPSNTASLGYDDINVFAEDAIGNIWIGTNGGGLNYFDRKTNSFKKLTHDPANTNSLSNDVIVSLYIDHEQNLWIGTYYGGLDRYDGKTFTHYRHSDTNPASIADNKVWEIYEDVDGNLWIGTLDGGLDMFDREHNIFHHHKSGEPNSVYANYIPAFAEDTQNNLWVGTSYGIDVLEKSSGKFIHYSNTDNKLSNNNIIDLLKDSHGNMWIGTRDGLNVFDTAKKTFQSFRTEDGLPDNNILNILEDNKQNIWVSTANGISRIKVQGNQQQGFKITCKNYDESDGLQGKEFNENASLKTSTGELVFGGANGFNIFNPENISTNKNIPPVAFTDFQLFNRSVIVGEKVNGNIILPAAISQTSEITLNYDENIFSIEFAALSFANTEKSKYAYTLKGFNKTWSTTDGKARIATYTNLDPGDYTFIVKASNDDDVWNEKGIALKITILPPFWKTPLAYLLYFLAVAAILYFARLMIIQRAHMRFALEQERKEANRMHELDMMKIRFFTNVSHEFRTPLSLILTPLDKIIKTTTEPDKKSQFQLIHRNARRLLNLVNQLLDFRKMEVQELKLHPSNGDIAKFIKEISYTFTDLAGNKNIEFSYQSTIDELYTKFDHDKIERILFNLLSNAFKFTSENGKVSVELNSYQKDGDTLIEIKIKDTGIGIPPEKQEKIFERFFQNDIPGTMVNQGSGIGLAITREFVKLHDGFISVESEVDKGSCFTVLLPFTETTATENQPDIVETEEAEYSFAEEKYTSALQPLTEKSNTSKNKKPVVLIVEDNEDFRFYLKDNLTEFFTIAEAVNGKEGWQKVLSAHPDLVVSDISMPVMNGIDLCRKIKQDPRTAQIPVILLTALMGEDQQLKGLETGASDYITKPFSFEIMLSRIKNILTEQASLKKVFTKQVEVKTTEVTVESPNEKFIQQALEIVEKNLSNTAFSVEELSRELYMSRVSVYKKIFTITGKTPIEFVRSIRLKHAAQLLEKSNLTIAEIAYESGFNNPKYFTKYFKAEFNVVPSEYAAQKKKEAENS